MNRKVNSGVVAVIVIVVVAMAVSAQRRRLWNGPSGEPETVSCDLNDAEMNAAMEKARQSVDVFLAALNTPGVSQSNFSIKAGFSVSGSKSCEYIWLNDVRFEDGVFVGAVGNPPEKVDSIRFGDTVRVARGKIADWMFTDGKRLRGSYTMRVVRNRLSPEEFAKFDSQCDFIID